MATNPYNEAQDAQEPAVRLLEALGYERLSPQEANALRGNDRYNPVLTDVLARHLREHNEIDYKGEQHPFSKDSIRRGIDRLQRVPGSSLMQDNKTIYERLSLGVSIEQTVAGDTKSHPMHYVDWTNPENNTYHVVAEYPMASPYHEKPRRLDVVAFVNGIPFVVIECKRRDHPRGMEAAIARLREYQTNEQIPDLFRYAHLLVGVQPNAVRYGTTKTTPEFWSRWREQEVDADTAVAELMSQSPDTVREQDRVLWALCKPDRLLKLVRRYITYDAGTKKIARYQQYFAVEKILQRVQERTVSGRRQGGVVWHTQGSGKSLTMVFLAKALVVTDVVYGPRVLLVTDRTSLDRQLWTTFRHCGMEPTRAKTGRELGRLLHDRRERVITTVVNKFKTAVRTAKQGTNEDENLFVLVDESHRTQYGVLHHAMRQMLPKACYIGFTGTPLTKEEKNTARTFGGIIDEYTIDQAVKDEAVVSLVYEGRHPRQDVQETPLDDSFDRLTRGQTEQQVGDVKKRATYKTRLRETQETLRRVAWDIADHYVANWQGTGLKGQVATTSKAAAVLMHRAFEEDGRVSTRVVISPPDRPETEADFDSDSRKQIIQDYWDERVTPAGGEEAYNRAVRDSFSDDDGVELLIVVSMLLTGFDEPRNTILYVNRSLREHTLLQAIARVNRLHPLKDVGYVMDYWGILGELDEALTSYEALSNYDSDDLKNAVLPVREEVHRLKDAHTALWQIFDGVESDRDPQTVNREAMERHLEPQDRRDTFYERVTAFTRSLQSVLSTEYFHDTHTEAQIERYTSHATFFQSMRRSVRVRYGERVDFDKYDARVRKLLDRYVSADEVQRIVNPVDVFDKEAFHAEIREVGKTPAAKADAIAHRVKRTTEERMDENPALYKRLSELIRQAIEDFHQQRIDQLEYLQIVEGLEGEMESEGTSTVPYRLQNRPDARAYHDAVVQALDENADRDDIDVPTFDQEALVEIALKVRDIVREHTIVDWGDNNDVKNDIRNDVEDYLYLQKSIPLDVLSPILDDVIRIAKSWSEK